MRVRGGRTPGTAAAPAAAGTTGGRPRAQDAWLRRLAAYCWRHRRLVIMALGGSLLATLVQASIPLIMAWIVDSAILENREPIWLGASVLIVAGLLSFAGVYTRRYRGGQLSLDVQHDMRTELFGSLERLDGARQDQLHTGQIVSRSISDLNMVQSLLSQMPMLLGNALLFVLSISIMAYLSPVLTLVALAIAPALWLIAIASRRKLFPASWDAQQKEAQVAGVVDGAVTGVRVVKGFGQEEQEIERLEGVSTRLYSARLRVVRLTARYNPALGAVPMFGQVGVLLAFSLYIGQMVAPVRALTSLVTIGQEARASVIRVYEVIDSRPVVTEKPGAVVLAPGTPDIELDDVAFGYLPSQPVLKGLSLHVRPGETVALVGTSGSGKSTISLLLPRFYDVRGGAIRVGGHDVRDLTLESLRASIGLVMEDSFLFSDTIRANIAYGRPDATREQVVAAARAAEADEFISSLADGYDTVIGEQGLTLSGGQRQRVSLARALITDPAILILDDATSAIDAAVEAQIHATLHKVMAGRTTLLNAHRRSTLQLADRIAVLDEGRLVDEGTHEELTARCPLYRLLLAGPGDDAEGLDAGELGYHQNAGELGYHQNAGELAYHQNAGRGAPAARRGLASGTVTPSLWETGDDAAGSGPATGVAGRQSARAPGAAIGRGFGAAARGGRGASGAAGGMLAGIPPTPELLAKVDALPPANELPGISQAGSRAADPHFTLRRLLRPIALALFIGLVLDGLDAVASIAMPALVRGGVDHGVLGKAFHPILVVSLIGLVIVCADWVINVIQTNVVGRNGERMLYTLRVKIFSHLQRLGLDFYEREMSGRIMTRMTTDVDAMDTFLQTGLI